MLATSRESQSYVKAGAITRELKQDVESRDWRSKTYFELCEFVERKLKEKGALPAFPVNVCADDIAAHYTAEIDDEKKVGEQAILKVDIGAQVEGFVADTAVTLCYNEELLDMAEATKAALAEALKGIRTGVKTGDIGRIVEAYAQRRGYQPIQNLSGHSLEQYQVHAGVSIPNVWAASNSTFKQNKAYAVEPFFTTLDASGIVIEGRAKNIFSLVARKKTKDKKLNDFLDLVWDTCKTLPFAARWFSKAYTKEELDLLLSQAMKLRLVHSYPVLVEAKGRPVAQAEHTVVPTETGLVVLT